MSHVDARVQAYTRSAMADKAPQAEDEGQARAADGVLGTLPGEPPGTHRPPRVAAAAEARRARPRSPAKRHARPKPRGRDGPPPPALTASRHGAPDAPPPRSRSARRKGTELVTTTIRAAGELAQIGFDVGGQVLKRTIDRIPAAVASRRDSRSSGSSAR